MAEYCVVRQRAGPLVKTYTTDRKRFVEWAKRSDMGRLSAPCMWAKSADTAINRKWWDFMADIMETNPDNSPVCIDLKPVFHLD